MTGRDIVISRDQTGRSMIASRLPSQVRPQMSASAIYQQLTRCKALTPYAETSLPRQRARSSSYVPFESQWLILCLIQPTTGKACSLQTTHQIGHFAGGVPDDPRFVIRDHA